MMTVLNKIKSLKCYFLLLNRHLSLKEKIACCKRHYNSSKGFQKRFLKFFTLKLSTTIPSVSNLD